MNEVPANVRPFKHFFVEMLTRDISLIDSILDLLDNCIDGVSRSVTAPGLITNDAVTESQVSEEYPLSGFKAELTFDSKHFQISDNCGGIPFDILKDTALRFGRSGTGSTTDNPNLIHTVGAYGIGMKRAVFKIGRLISINTCNQNDVSNVTINEDWLRNDDEWNLSIVHANRDVDVGTLEGTTINVQSIRPEISAQFSNASFKNELIQRISEQYAVLISKGFVVKVKDETVIAKPMLMRNEETPASDRTSPLIKPYQFSTIADGVSIRIIVGLRGLWSDPNEDEDEDGDLSESEYRADDAGWTIICNDRVVQYADKSELTGWGSAYGLPRYHAQYRAIHGVVFFDGPPEKLPTTTTKRGLDWSSPIYQTALAKMVEGTKLFVSFTNRWKNKEQELNAKLIGARAYPVGKLVTALNNVKSRAKADKPTLPIPRQESDELKVTFYRDWTSLQSIARVVSYDELQRNNKSATILVKHALDMIEKGRL